MSLLQLLKDKAFQKKEVTLASGRKSNFYIDVKRVSLTAEGAYLIGQELFQLLRSKFTDVTAVGGLTLGADPLVTAVAYTSWLEKQPLQSFIVRKEAKSYGLNKMIEGADLIPAGSKVLILEDVVTSGQSGRKAVDEARKLDWEVLGVLAVVDRQEGGQEAFDCPFYSLYQKSDFGIVEK